MRRRLSLAIEVRPRATEVCVPATRTGEDPFENLMDVAVLRRSRHIMSDGGLRITAAQHAQRQTSVAQIPPRTSSDDTDRLHWQRTAVYEVCALYAAQVCVL